MWWYHRSSSPTGAAQKLISGYRKPLPLQRFCDLLLLLSLLFVLLLLLLLVFLLFLLLFLLVVVMLRCVEYTEEPRNKSSANSVNRSVRHVFEIPDFFR